MKKEIDWREIYILQFGSRDYVSEGKIIKGQVVVDWYNDNGWGLTTAKGRQKMKYKDGKLAFAPNEIVANILEAYND